jgi:CheY-like chemotaxis protein
MHTRLNPAPLRVLVVEDSETDRDCIRRFLQRAEGFSTAVSEAATLQQARAALAGAPFDVCLVDLHLPDGLGIELLHCARAATPDTLVVLLTTDPDVCWDEQALALGADGYLLKSEWTSELLVRTIRYGLRNRAALARATAAGSGAAWADNSERVVPICMDCRRIRDAVETWHPPEVFVSEVLGARLSHGLCPGCLTVRLAELGTQAEPSAE